MTHQTLELPQDPEAALATLYRESQNSTVLVFKKSPICTISFAAEKALSMYLAKRVSDAPLHVAYIDVLGERALARGLTATLDIQHASPQALVFASGELQWHGSHSDLTPERFQQELEDPA